MPDTDAPVFGQSMSQISRHVDSMARSRRAWGRLFEPFWVRAPGYQDDPAGGSAACGADARSLEEPADAGTIHQGREGA